MTTNAMRIFLAKRLRAIVLAGCVLALSASAGTLWVAESRGTLKLDALDGAVVLELPEAPFGSSAVGVDSTNGNVWTWGEQRLRGFDRDGVNFLDVESTTYPLWEHPSRLVVDGDAGNIWLNLGSNLHRLNLTGQVVGSLLHDGADPCHASSVANAALFAGLGGGLAARFFPVPGMYTLAQARFFAPSTLAGLVQSAFIGSAAVSAGVGGAANFGGPF